MTSRLHRGYRHRWPWQAGGTGLLAVLLVAWLVVTATAQEAGHSLRPPDRSSPRATLRTFLEAGDALGAFLATNYIDSPSRAGFHRAVELSEPVMDCLDLSALPAATRMKSSRAAAMSLYGVLNRIPLPPLEAIPDAAQLALLPSVGTNSLRWVIPETEIVIERIATGPQAGKFLFSSDTVARAGGFLARVEDLPYVRKVPLENLRDTVMSGGGWWIPFRLVRAMPVWLRMPVAEQAVWKWLGLGLSLTVFGTLLGIAFGLSRRGSPEHPFLQALAQAALPVFLLVATPALEYVALLQVNLTGAVATLFELAATATRFVAGAWISWRLAPVVAEGIIASPRIAPESVDAHLIRITTRLLGIVGAAVLLAMGADRLGIPVYGIVAGLGVGGIAIALAAQSTIENLIGGLNLFADRPIRVGDLCRCGNDEGVVEAIGIRSTRLRGLDRTVTVIPNAALSKVSIVNLTQRDRIQLKAVLGVRYETSADQLRHLLAHIRELLLSHPRIDPATARARFIGFGASSLDLEVMAYVLTRDWAEFLAIREDVWLRIMDLVEQSGTGFAFPSQTLYLARDGGVDAARAGEAEAEVGRWRDENRLPFPDFTAAEREQMRDCVPYPPPGAPGAGSGTPPAPPPAAPGIAPDADRS